MLRRRRLTTPRQVCRTFGTDVRRRGAPLRPRDRLRHPGNGIRCPVEDNLFVRRRVRAKVSSARAVIGRRGRELALGTQSRAQPQRRATRRAQNSLNPFGRETTISYELPDKMKEARLMFYDAQGKLVKAVDKGAPTVPCCKVRCYRPRIVKTTRNCASPLIIRAYASAAFSRGYVSMIGRTPVSSAKRSVSSESAGVPVDHP
jgi:hypothetical protein